MRKKAALCLLRLFRKSPEVMSAADWAPKILGILNHTENVRTLKNYYILLKFDRFWCKLMSFWVILLSFFVIFLHFSPLFPPFPTLFAIF